MCMIGKMAGKVVGLGAKVSPFGALGIANSLFGGKSKTKTRTIVEPFNARGSYTDNAGNTVVPREVVAAQRATSGTGVGQSSLFAKTGK